MTKIRKQYSTKVKRLISLVKERRALYDRYDVNYMNIAEKNRAWKEIASILKVPDKICKTKWRNLRDVYRKINWRRCDDQMAPSKKTWYCSEDMEFLKPFIRQRYEQYTHGFIDGEETAATRDSSNLPKQPTFNRSDSKNIDDGGSFVESTNDPITEFFFAMAVTAKRFPPHIFLEAKTKVFEAISNLEAENMQGASVGDHSYA